MRSTNRCLVVLATTLGTAAGLLVGAPAVTADPGSVSSAPADQPVDVLVRGDHTLSMPGVVRPGLASFRVTARRMASFQIFRPAAGYTPREATKDANAAFTRNDVKALRRFEAHVSLFGGISASPGQPAFMSVILPTGGYWALDVTPRVLNPSKAFRFKVAGAPVGGHHTGHLIRAVGATRWSTVTPRLPTRGRIWFQNRSRANHFMVLAPLARGRTMADFRTWVRRTRQGRNAPPPLSLQGGVETGVLSPGRSMDFPYALRPGRYVLMCFWPDADRGGTPHVLLGMYRSLRVG